MSEEKGNKNKTSRRQGERKKEEGRRGKVIIWKLQKEEQGEWNKGARRRKRNIKITNKLGTNISFTFSKFFFFFFALVFFALLLGEGGGGGNLLP